MQKQLETLIVSKAGYREAAYHTIKEAILSGYLKQGLALVEKECNV